MNRLAALFLPAGMLLVAAPALAAPEKLAIYMTVGGPVEVVRDGASSSVLLNGRPILQAAGASLTAQSYMSVGDPADGFDAVLIRHGVGNAECPITYDLVTVGNDKTYAVVEGINKCSRILNVNTEGDKLLFTTEKQNGKTEVIEYNDTLRRTKDHKP